MNHISKKSVYSFLFYFLILNGSYVNASSPEESLRNNNSDFSIINDSKSISLNVPSLGGDITAYTDSKVKPSYFRYTPFLLIDWDDFK